MRRGRGGAVSFRQLPTIAMPAPTRGRFGRRRSTAAFALSMMIVAIELTLGGGCASSIHRARHWIVGGMEADYQTAERLARQSGTGILILYTNIDLTRDDPVREAVKTAAARGNAKDYVRCVLFQNNEPDRRYVAQYGVDRCPAVIAVHPDGTYHARAGAMSVEQAEGFFAGATPPGSTPKVNPYIPREPSYAWGHDLESAERTAGASGRPLLVVLDRWMTRDWRKLRSMLERREVYTRFADMVHCRPGSLWSSAGSAAARFGVRNMPAVVIVEPDGSFHVLELPSSYETIVRFSDGIRRGAAPTEANASPAAGSAAGGSSAAAAKNSPSESRRD